jgi:hypothetical protein
MPSGTAVVDEPGAVSNVTGTVVLEVGPPDVAVEQAPTTISANSARTTRLEGSRHLVDIIFDSANIGVG